MIRLFHTADVHIGLKFTRGYAESLQESLIAERLAVLKRMVDLANQERCQLFVVAGDLFDNTRIPRKTLKAAAEALSRFEGLVAVLPGNHDYAQPVDDPVWPAFAEFLGERHLVLRERRPYDLGTFDLPAVLYPGVCHSKHSKENAVRWIAAALEAASRDKTRIGVAHGSLEGLSPDFNGDYFPMTSRELESLDLDVWLLGHTHIRYPDMESGRDARIFYPATPEPDGFDCRHPGYAWIIDVDQDGQRAYRSVQTGTYQFHHRVESRIDSETDLARLKHEFQKMQSGRYLVKLKLQGRLHGDVFDQLPRLRADLASCVHHLEMDTAELVRAVRQSDIDSEFTQDSFPHRFLSELAASEDDELALQLAYELVKEARQ